MKTPNRITSVVKHGVVLVGLLYLISIAQSEETKRLESRQTNGTATLDPEFRTYKNPTYKFQVSYPRDWRTANSVNDALWKIAKATTNEIGSVSISAARYTGNDPSLLQTMLGQEENILQETRRRFPDAKILDKGKSFLGSYPAVHFETQYTVKNLNVETKIVTIQILCIRDSLLYVVSFETTKASYEKTQPQFQAIISSFIFTSPESATRNTGIKAFDNLFFGEEKAVVEKKRMNRVLVGEIEFELFCLYEKIGGKEMLSGVCLKAKWPELEEPHLKNRVEEVERILTSKFGKPNWKANGTQEENAEEKIGALQCFWEVAKEKRIYLYKTHKVEIEDIKVKDDSFPGKLFGREVDSIQIRKESGVTISISSPAIEEMKAKEVAEKAIEAGASF